LRCSTPAIPPTDEDFDALVAQLERRDQAGAAGVWMRAGPSGDEVVFADRSLPAGADGSMPALRRGRRRGAWRRVETTLRAR
jgi:hypothetical protein